MTVGIGAGARAFRTRRIDLSVARTDANPLVIDGIGGRVLALAPDGFYSLKVELINAYGATQSGAAFGINSGAVLRGITFEQIKITNAAQPGKTAVIIISQNEDVALDFGNADYFSVGGGGGDYDVTPPAGAIHTVANLERFYESLVGGSTGERFFNAAEQNAQAKGIDYANPGQHNFLPWFTPIKAEIELAVNTSAWVRDFTVELPIQVTEAAAGYSVAASYATEYIVYRVDAAPTEADFDGIIPVKEKSNWQVVGGTVLFITTRVVAEPFIYPAPAEGERIIYFALQGVLYTNGASRAVAPFPIPAAGRYIIVPGLY